MGHQERPASHHHAKRDGTDLRVAPGSVVVVRDEEWLVTNAERLGDAWRLTVRGVSELVRDQDAIFLSDLDHIEALDPRGATVVRDGSPRYRRSRLWLEATLRRTPIPAGETRLVLADHMLVNRLAYQRVAVAKALRSETLRPRLLLADAVGLGKTLEIGLILAELIARGRGERILVVTPRHILDQTQHELWTRFAIPLVRLDSEGIQRVRQKLPATRNPFTYYRRVIISIDTLKSKQYLQHLEKQRWDVVIIDESHNVTNDRTLNNELARVLARTTEALLLASATPHNGRRESFAELLRLLDPTSVDPNGEFTTEDAQRLFIRRHRHSEDVAREVGSKWAERRPPQVVAVTPTPAEDAVADELARTWLYPADGRALATGQGAGLFPWGLAKSYLSSLAALEETVEARLRRLAPAGETPEVIALRRLLNLADDAGDGAKLAAVVDRLRAVGVGPTSRERVVLFAERIATLEWLLHRLPDALSMPDESFAILYGGVPDQRQQEIIEDFKLSSSKVRVLITGDIASEGVNLHAQCHHLLHVDIPWSLIRIEQRNGRIDRYGQEHHPTITALALTPTNERFGGDVHVLARLLEKEHEAHTTLGDAASLMGKHDEKLEEEVILKLLQTGGDLNRLVPGPEDLASGHQAFLDTLFSTPTQENEAHEVPLPRLMDDLTFLRQAIEETAADVEWEEPSNQGLAILRPPADLVSRLEVLPQTYLRERRVREKLVLATRPTTANDSLRAAADGGDATIWPEAHFLSPLHPVLDWATDKMLAGVGRNEVFAVRALVTMPTVLLMGSLMNLRGQVVTRQFVTVGFPTGSSDLALPEPINDLHLLAEAGIDGSAVNPDDLVITDQLQALIPAAVDQALVTLSLAATAGEEQLRERLAGWRARTDRWRRQFEQMELTGIARHQAELVDRRVREEQALTDSLAPIQRLVRPLLVLVPESTPLEAP